MEVRDIAKQLFQFFVFMLSCILYCLITSPPPPTPPFTCLFSYFRLFASNSPYFGSWLYNCSMNSLSFLFFFPKQRARELQHYIYVPCWVIYQKFILKKFGISFETQFGYMYCDRGKQVELSHTLYCKYSNQNTPPSTPQMLSHTKLFHFLEESAINYVDT